MANYVENIKVGSGEVWSVRDAEAQAAIEALNTEVANKAPAGYGLGTAEEKTWGDVDNILQPGWYAFYDSVVIDGYTFDAAGMRVDALDATSVVQTIHPQYTPTVELKRHYISGVWYDWEWVNPLMIPWHEYRTTERYNSSPVYVYCVTMTDIPSSGEKSTDIGVTMTNVISIEGTLKYTDTSYPFPAGINGSLGVYAWVRDTSVGISLTGTSDLSGSTALLIVKYTK